MAEIEKVYGDPLEEMEYMRYALKTADSITKEQSSTSKFFGVIIAVIVSVIMAFMVLANLYIYNKQADMINAQQERIEELTDIIIGLERSSNS